MNRKSKLILLICIFALIGNILSINPLVEGVCEIEPIRIAFIDTGISTKHIDTNKVEIGKNYIFEDQDTKDRIGHGTATAGMVLGSKKLGIEGSCPDALVVPLVTYDRYVSGVSKVGDISMMSQAIYDAVDIYNCRVINISMGVSTESEELHLALLYAEEKGAVVVSAVGNDNLTYPDRKYYPAIYNTVLGVGAAENLQEDFAVADFSQQNGVSVLAKGANLETISHRNDTKPIIRSGTSYACAYVSGLCAQLLIDSPSLTPAQVRAILYASAQDLGILGVDLESGWGIVGIDRSNSESVTRGMLASLLYTYDGEPESENSSFKDVLPDSYYNKAIGWAADNGIVLGYSNSKFGPDDNITKEQLTVILHRYAKLKNYDVSLGEDTNILSYKDVKKVSEYAISSMQWACGINLFQDKDGKLLPQDKISKEEIVDIFLQFSRNTYLSQPLP